MRLDAHDVLVDARLLEPRIDRRMHVRSAGSGARDERPSFVRLVGAVAIHVVPSIHPALWSRRITKGEGAQREPIGIATIAADKNGSAIGEDPATRHPRRHVAPADALRRTSGRAHRDVQARSCVQDEPPGQIDTVGDMKADRGLRPDRPRAA